MRIIALSATIFIGLGFIYYQGPPPILTAITSIALEGLGSTGVSEMSAMRAEVTKGHLFGGAYRGQGIFKVVLPAAWTVIFSYCLILFLSRVSTYQKIVLIMIVSIGMIYLIADSSRGPLVKAIIAVAVCYSFYYSYNVKTIVVSIGSVLFLAVGVSFLSPKGAASAGTDNPITDMGGKIVKRIILGNAQNDVLAIVMSKEDLLDYRYGQIHARDFVAMLPGTAGGKPFANELSQIVKGRPNLWYLTGTYVTKTYMDGHYFGVIVGFMLVGFILGVGSQLLVLMPSSPLIVSINAFSVYALGYLGTTGPVMLPPLILSIVIVLLVFRLSSAVNHSYEVCFGIKPL